MQCHAIFARRLYTTLQSSTLCQAYYATFPVSCTNNMQLLGHNQANIDQFSAWLPFRPLPPPLSPPPLLIELAINVSAYGTIKVATSPCGKFLFGRDYSMMEV